MAYRGTGPVSSVVVSGTADLAAAASGYKHVLLGGILTAGAAGATFKFQSGASTDLTGAMTVAANTPITIPVAEDGYLETVVGEKLNIVVSAGAVTGVVTLQKVK